MKVFLPEEECSINSLVTEYAQLDCAISNINQCPFADNSELIFLHTFGTTSSDICLQTLPKDSNGLSSISSSSSIQPYIVQEDGSVSSTGRFMKDNATSWVIKLDEKPALLVTIHLNLLLHAFLYTRSVLRLALRIDFFLSRYLSLFYLIYPYLFLISELYFEIGCSMSYRWLCIWW